MGRWVAPLTVNRARGANLAMASTIASLTACTAGIKPNRVSHLMGDK